MKKDPEEDNIADADGKMGEKSDQTGNMNEKFLFLTRSWREPCQRGTGRKKNPGRNMWKI